MKHTKTLTKPATKAPTAPASSLRVIVAVTHEVLNAERFEHVSDLMEAVKCRCATLQIPYDSRLVSEALDVVERTRRTVPDPFPRATNPTHEEHPPDGPIIGPDEARAHLAAIRARLGQVPLRTIAPAPWRDPEAEARAEEEARQRAAEMGITW